MSNRQGRDEWLVRQFHTDLRLIQEDTLLPLDKLGAIKTELLHLLPEMKVLAEKGVAKAQFYLAQAFNKDSKEYLIWMKKASQHGVVDAHFALGQYYLERNDMNKASAFFNRVVSSNDQFLKNEIIDMLHSNPVLEKWMSQSSTPSSYFFNSVDDNKLTPVMDEDKPIYRA